MADKDRFLVRWSLSGLLFLLFSIFLSFYLSIFLFSNYCNFMWFIKLRASAGMCGVCAHGRGCVCAGVHRCEHVCASVHTCTWVVAGVCGCTYMYMGVCGCVLVWAGVCGMRRCAWACVEVCGSALVSVSLCVGWIFRIASGD